MGLFKRGFRMGRVYAGPEQMGGKNKEEFEMRDVYAGPEQMGVPEFVRDSGEEVPEEQTERKKRVPPPRETHDDIDMNTRAMLRAVYAAPDVMEATKVPDPAENNPRGGAPYPFNNAVLDNSAFQIPGENPGAAEQF